MAQGTASNLPFPHLTVPLIIRDRARLQGGPNTGAEEAYNIDHRAEHADALRQKAGDAIAVWQGRRRQRDNESLPPIPQDIPLFLRVEPGSDIDYLKNFFAFEIISEYEDGFVIVASHEIEMTQLLAKLEQFPNKIMGSATVAKIYDILGPDNQDIRLQRILSKTLYDSWSAVVDAQVYTVDLSIECLGSVYVRDPPEQNETESNGTYQNRLIRWREEYNAALNQWDDLMMERENDLLQFILGYQGKVLDIIHDDHHLGATRLPDSFTVRVVISGKGLRDLVLNYPFLFEVAEPDSIELLIKNDNPAVTPVINIEFSPPNEDASKVCVIDSGIQEQHPYLVGVIDSNSSRCYIPEKPATEVGDFVRDGGHGTRVAGAVIFPKGVPTSGNFKFSYWIQNARVLNEFNMLPDTLQPSLYLTKIVGDYVKEGTKIFNHSISAYRPCRLQRMSAWAATIDLLSWQHDILFVQSAGNLPALSEAKPFRLGVLDHFAGGREYPGYLNQDSCRIATPSESLQALTVGSINHCDYENGNLTLVGGDDQPSAFTTTGLGIWGSIKPDVVEYGGGWVTDNSTPPNLTTPPEVCTELIRSTMHGGPLVAKDEIGTSFSAPKVSSIAATIQNLFPSEPSLLYRALIINSAAWPAWAEQHPNKLNVLRQIGYGIPDPEKAVGNTPYRVTLISSGHNYVKAREAHIYQVPIPDQLRAPGEDFRIRISVTLAYSAKPRRTRRGIKKYLSTWVDWKSSHKTESYESFKNDILHQGDKGKKAHEGVIPWMIRETDEWGGIKGVRRNNSTVQKDWAILHSHELPNDFCIGVIGHEGWDKDPEATAKYSLVISFEAINQDMEIYSEIEAAVEALIAPQKVQAEIIV